MMARTLLQDFWGRATRRLTAAQAAARLRRIFGVSASSAIRWRQLALEHGQAFARPRGGDRHSGRSKRA